MPKKDVGRSKATDYEQVPEDCANGSIPIFGEQVEEAGEEILEILSPEARDNTLEFVYTAGEARCVFVEPLCLQSHSKLTICSNS